MGSLLGRLIYPKVELFASQRLEVIANGGAKSAYADFAPPLAVLTAETITNNLDD